mgnify:CR=1 FL=1
MKCMYCQGEMKQGDAVTFETEESDKGPKAVNVSLDNGMEMESESEAEAA